MNRKITLSLLSILIVALIVVLMPRINPKNGDSGVPRFSYRNIPAPTPTPKDEIVEISGQQPGDYITVRSIKSDNIYIKVYKNETLIGQTDLISEPTDNLVVNLSASTKDGDMLKVKALDQNNEEVYSQDVLITVTAILPNAILPKELQ